MKIAFKSLKTFKFKKDPLLDTDIINKHFKQRLNVTGKEVTCQCTHLSNFAIMMDFTNQVKSNDPGRNNIINYEIQV